MESAELDFETTKEILQVNLRDVYAFFSDEPITEEISIEDAKNILFFTGTSILLKATDNYQKIADKYVVFFVPSQRLFLANMKKNISKEHRAALSVLLNKVPKFKEIGVVASQDNLVAYTIDSNIYIYDIVNIKFSDFKNQVNSESGIVLASIMIEENAVAIFSGMHKKFDFYSRARDSLIDV